jgi:flagellar motor switch protein FliM
LFQTAGKKKKERETNLKKYVYKGSEKTLEEHKIGTGEKIAENKNRETRRKLKSGWYICQGHSEP